MKTLFLMIVFSLFVLTGCVGMGTLENDIAVKGASTADNMRDVAVWTLCKGISVGAWVRAYGDSADKANAWRTICAEAAPQTPAKP